MARTVPAKGASVRALVLDAAARLERAGVCFGHGTTNAVDEAAWLVLHALGLPVQELGPYLDLAVDAARAREASALVAKRIRTRKPAAYLLNEAWLGPHRFFVDERVIVPRSFIGELLEDGLAAVVPDAESVGSVLDLCTGSGCLAILAALAFPRARVDAADISEDALAVARRNVADYELGARVSVLSSDLFGGLAGRRYDLIISNPPYVTTEAVAAFPPEQAAEPILAHAGGEDGLDIVRGIIAGAGQHLTPQGALVVEVGTGRDLIEAEYPDLPFLWLDTAESEGEVFALQAGDLPLRARGAPDKRRRRG